MRKGLGFILVVFIMCSCQGTKHLLVGPGYQMKYDLVTNQQSLRLDVNVVQTKGPWVYDYTVSGEDISGRITMTEKALQSSSELSHHFIGVDKTLTNSTSLRLSTASFNALSNGDTTNLAYRQGFVKNNLQYAVVEKQHLKYLIDGKLKSLEVLYVEDVQGKGNALWVWNNASAPIILRVKFGYELILKEMLTH